MLTDEILGRDGEEVPDAGPSRNPMTLGSGFMHGQDFEYLAGTEAPAGAPTITGTGAFAQDTVTHGGSGLVFVNTYGAGVTTAFHNAIIAAETYLESHFTNSITIHVSFDLQSLNPAYSGSNQFSGVMASYNQVISALQTHATSPDDFAAVNKLFSTPDPSGGGQSFFVPNAQAKMLGLPGTTNGTDDSVILNNLYWNDASISANMGDAVGVLMHELTEGAMGRIGGGWAMMDLFRYTALGQLDDTGGQDGKPTYFSPNGQNINTGLQYHNPINAAGQDDGFDWADWDQVGQDANAHDPFGPGGPGAGDPGVLSTTDLQIMDVLGWTKASTKQDLNNDSVADLVWWNSTTGDAGWTDTHNGNAWHGGIGATPTYSLTAVGDFNHDGYTDVIWHNNTTGDTGWTDLHNAGAWHGIGASTAYSIVGVGDFNGDGYDDIIWQNKATGAAGWTDVHNANAWHGNSGPAGYSIVGTGDFNNDGYIDALWWNSTTGDAGWTDLHAGDAWHGSLGKAGYSVAGVGDISGDGYADILWKNASTGNVGWTDPHNGNAWHNIATTPYSVARVREFNGDGYADILWHNVATGDTGWTDLHNNNAWHGIGASTTYQAT